MFFIISVLEPSWFIAFAFKDVFLKIGVLKLVEGNWFTNLLEIKF